MAWSFLHIEGSHRRSPFERGSTSLAAAVARLWLSDHESNLRLSLKPCPRGLVKNLFLFFPDCGWQRALGAFGLSTQSGGRVEPVLLHRIESQTEPVADPWRHAARHDHYDRIVFGS